MNGVQSADEATGKGLASSLCFEALKSAPYMVLKLRKSANQTRLSLRARPTIFENDDDAWACASHALTCFYAKNVSHAAISERASYERGRFARAENRGQNTGFGRSTGF